RQLSSPLPVVRRLYITSVTTRRVIPGGSSTTNPPISTSRANAYVIRKPSGASTPWPFLRLIVTSGSAPPRQHSGSGSPEAMSDRGPRAQPAGSGGYGEGCGKAPGQHALGLSQMLYPSRDSGCLPGGGAGSGEMEHRSGQTPLAQARRGGPVKLSAALQRGRQTQGIRPGSSWRSSTSWYSPGGETALQLSM